MQDAEEISESYSSDEFDERESLDANLEERCNNWNIPLVPVVSQQGNRRAPGVQKKKKRTEEIVHQGIFPETEVPK
eukprot:3414593-Amphidinium_carterae.1